MGNRCWSHISNDRSSSLASWITSSLHAVRGSIMCKGALSGAHKLYFQSALSLSRHLIVRANWKEANKNTNCERNHFALSTCQPMYRSSMCVLLVTSCSIFSAVWWNWNAPFPACMDKAMNCEIKLSACRPQCVIDIKHSISFMAGALYSIYTD